MVADVKYEDIKIGDSASVVKKVTVEDVEAFAKVSTDTNPVHMSEEFAQTTMFKHRIAHGMLGAGLISAVLGTKLPGANTIYMRQTLQFLAPVYLDETITATVTCTEKNDEKHRMKFETICTNEAGKVVIKGEALVMKK